MNRNIAALAVTGVIIVSTTAGAAILTQPRHPAHSAATASSRVTVTPQATSPDHGEQGDPRNVPSICLNLPEDLWADCSLSWRIPISRDHDISGPDQVAECIDSYPVSTAKPELAICLDPNGPR